MNRLSRGRREPSLPSSQNYTIAESQQYPYSRHLDQQYGLPNQVNN